MKLFIIRNENGQYLQVKYNHLVCWVAKNGATFYNTREDAERGGNFAFNYEIDAEEHFEIIEINTDAAIEVLRDLFEVRDLGDCIYDIREREGEGWYGPKVTKWSNAVRRAKKLIEQKEINDE